MSNKWLVSLVTVGLCASVASAQQPPARANFSGQWVLAAIEAKDMPAGLKAYSMAVSQNAQQLEVRAALKGKLSPETVRTSQPLPQERAQKLPGGLLPNGEGQSNVVGTLTYGWPNASLQGVSGDTSEDGPPWKMAPPELEARHPCTQQDRMTFAAFILYPPSAVYMLDRRKSRTEFGGPRHAPAISEARFGNGGKVLTLSLTGKDALSRTCGMWHWTLLRDRWRLSKNGQELMVERTVGTSVAARRVHLTLRRQGQNGGERQE